MIFNSMTFLWIFLPIVLISYFLIKDKYKNLLLVVLSLIFYAWGEPTYVVLLIICILINYLIGILINKCKSSKLKKVLFAFGILANIGILIYFKYYNFFALNINKIFNTTLIATKKITLPIGVSFFTFSAISYLFDVYRKETKTQKNIIDFALYISFFPKLIMGPIERYVDFEKQLHDRKISIDKFSNGVKRFSYGLAKKVLIANTVGSVADFSYGLDISNLSTPVAWLGALCYMIQIYFDFSGYSDMAIGIGKMLGFDIIENFDLPYTSQSITEFWRRWHISLSNWFKHYLYIPLGGNRKGKIRTYINLSIVFLITGLWHGSAWNFIIWGLYNGFFIVIERIKLKELIDKNKFKFINYIYATFVTLVGWVLFRAISLKSALAYLKIMFVPTDGINYIYKVLNNKTIFFIIIGILFSGILQNLIKCIDKKGKLKKIYNYIEPIVILGLLGISIMTIISGTYNSFIYFKF